MPPRGRVQRRPAEVGVKEVFGEDAKRGETDRTVGHSPRGGSPLLATDTGVGR